MTASQPAYTAMELMACVAARMLEDRRTVLVGTGLPMIGAILAQRMHAPGLVIIFEAGGVGPRVPTLPVSVGDSRTFYHASAASSMHNVMSACQAGYVDFGFLGGAMMDRYGNLNTTVIGPWEAPEVRLPGSGGANDVGSLAQRTMIIIRQDTRRFVERVNFITTPGYIDGPGARERAGLPAGTGPYRVLTQLAVFDFDESTKQLRLRATHPGVSVAEVQAASGFKIQVADTLEVNAPPTEEERRLLHEIDPAGLVIGK